MRPTLRIERFALRGLVAAALAGALLLMPRPSSGDERGKVGPDPKTLKVLYAGNPGSDREKDFVALLEKHFQEVGTANFETIQPDDAKDFDVVVFDWTSVYHRDENGKMVMDSDKPMRMPKAPEVPRDWGRPVVMIGAAAGTMSHKLQTAINWKCLCLENRAHDVATDHPIFQGPLAVELEFVEEEKPFDYWAYPGSKALGETHRVWTVQTKSFPEVDPGLVSTHETFDAASDAEVLSGGVNGKGPTSVALGRHGNFFLWGFSGPPSDMTEAARAAFVNAVCYMDQFDGKTPGYPTQRHDERERFLADVYGLRMLSDAYVAKQVAAYQEMIRNHPPSEQQQAQVGDDPAKFFRELYAPHIEPVREKLLEEVRERFAGDDEALIAYCTENFDWLRREGDREGVWVVDEEAKSLGVSNRSRELLEKCVALLEAGEKTELAQRLLERYTGQKLEGAEAWREWLDGAESLRFEDAVGKFVTK